MGKWWHALLTSWCVLVSCFILLPRNQRARTSVPKWSQCRRILKVTVPLAATRGSSKKVPWFPHTYATFMWYREDDPFHLWICNCQYVVFKCFCCRSKIKNGWRTNDRDLLLGENSFECVNSSATAFFFSFIHLLNFNERVAGTYSRRKHY